MSSYLGGLLLSLGEWIIKKLPLVKHVYSAAKQVSAAVNPSNETAQSFRECVIIRHPRHGEFAFGFITGQTTLQVRGTSPAHAGPLPFCFASFTPQAASKLILGSLQVPLLAFSTDSTAVCFTPQQLCTVLHAWAAGLHAQLLAECLTSNGSVCL